MTQFGKLINNVKIIHYITQDKKGAGYEERTNNPERRNFLEI